MACYFTRPFILLITSLIFITYTSSSSSLALDNKNLLASTISAAPALLPTNSAPLSSSSSPPPALSPDITPLFPTPNGPELSPSQSSIPIIPSNPSPPNQDTTAASGPAGLAFAPSEPLLNSPSSSSMKLNVLPQFLILALGGFALIQLYV